MPAARPPVSQRFLVGSSAKNLAKSWRIFGRCQWCQWCQWCKVALVDEYQDTNLRGSVIAWAWPTIGLGQALHTQEKGTSVTCNWWAAKFAEENPVVRYLCREDRRL